jgi:hypothetical protein
MLPPVKPNSPIQPPPPKNNPGSFENNKIYSYPAERNLRMPINYQTESNSKNVVKIDENGEIVDFIQEKSDIEVTEIN